MTCQSCYWSAYSPEGLWCRLLSIPAGEVCRGFVYEPGAAG